MTSERKTIQPILIVDGLNLFVRHYVVSEQMDSNGNCIGGVMGFLKALNDMIERWHPSHVYIAWERGGSGARRRRIFPEYKANRKKSNAVNLLNEDSNAPLHTEDEDNRNYQKLLLITLLKKTPIGQLYLHDIEADDIVAYIAAQKMKDSSHTRIIVSSDKDYYQLLDDPNVLVFDPATKRTISGKDVLQKYDIHPRNFCVARSFVGDPSDNIPGVKGVGLKTLATRFPELKENRDIFLRDLIVRSREEILDGSKLKIHKTIVSASDITNRNWQLMYLRDFNLSPHETKKIDWQVENQDRQCDKISFIRELVRAKIATNLDVHRFFRNLTNLNLKPEFG